MKIDEIDVDLDELNTIPHGFKITVVELKKLDFDEFEWETNDGRSIKRYTFERDGKKYVCGKRVISLFKKAIATKSKEVEILKEGEGIRTRYDAVYTK